MEQFKEHKVSALGVSEHTVGKQATFSGLVSILARASKKFVNKKQEYFYIDLNAGPGRYGHNGHRINGSPIQAIRQLEQVGIPYRAILYEKNPDLRSHLQQNIVGNRSLIDIREDHNEIGSGPIPMQKLEWRRGIIYSDETETNIPWSILRKLAEAYGKMDIIIHLQAAGLKRAHLSLRKEAESIPKKYRCIQAPDAKHQWTFLILTNWPDLPSWKSKNIHRLESPEGEMIWRRLTETDNGRSRYDTYADYLSHPKFKKVRSYAMDRANGLCLQCKVSKATEIHHFVYPPWGTFDTEEDVDAGKLVPICHPCHCVLHGKED